MNTGTYDAIKTIFFAGGVDISGCGIEGVNDLDHLGISALSSHLSARTHHSWVLS
jgi:hypothetical protein